MKRWLWILFAILGAIFGCSRETAGSTFETENSIAIIVTDLGGFSVQSKLVIHRSDFLNWPGADSSEILQTDSLGILKIDSLPVGEYFVEAQTENSEFLHKGFCKFSVPKILPDSGLNVFVETAEPAMLRGEFLSEKTPVWIFIPGTDYAALVDSNGTFEFSSLPRGVLEWTAVYVADSAGVILGEGSVDVAADTVNVLLQDTVSKKILFEDFENGLGEWYRSVSEFATATLELDTLSDRGSAAHLIYQIDSVANWALLGRSFGAEVDMSDLDSVVFFAKGSQGSRISFSFDAIADSADVFESGKSWEHFELDSAWNRFVVRPSELLAADSIGGNVGWDAVKTHVTNISIFGAEGSELWLDDITFYGIDFESGI